MKNNAAYSRVQGDLKRSIIKGDYELGAKLPSENELASKYGFSRMTIRKAMDHLESEGVIFREKGKRSTVKMKAQFGWLSMNGFTKMKDNEKRIDTSFVSKPTIKPWDIDSYWELSDREKEGECIFLARVRYMSNRPVIVEEMYFSDRDLNGFWEAPLINRSLFDTLLVKYDIETTDVVKKFRAIPATSQLASTLDLPVGGPVLEISRKLITSKKGFQVYSLAYCHTDEYSVGV